MKYSVALMVLALAGAGRLPANWPTFGGDAQRSGWAREESEISPNNVRQMRLVWTLKLDNQPRELNMLTSPIAISPVYTNSGVKNLVVVGGSSDNLFVIDADTGKLVWQKHFPNEGPPPSGPQSSGSYFCPNALNDTPAVIHTNVGYTVYVISTDGELHGLNLLNGEDRFPAHNFVPAYSKNWSLNVANGSVYTTTSQGCAAAPSAVWAIDVSNASMPVGKFVADRFGGGMWGRGGVAIAENGTVYAATGDGPVDPAGGKYGDSVVALAPKTLQMSDYFTPPNANYLTRKDLDMGNTTPVLFTLKDHQYLVIGGKEGVLTLLDTKSLGGDTHRKAVYQTPQYLNAEADIAGRGFWGAFASLARRHGRALDLCAWLGSGESGRACLPQDKWSRSERQHPGVPGRTRERISCFETRLDLRRYERSRTAHRR